MVDVLGVDLARPSYDAALATRAARTGSTTTAKTGRVAKAAPREGKRFTVILDPGHGGIDSGAEGVSGIRREGNHAVVRPRISRNALEESTGRYNVFMTRDDDRFVRLGERVRLIARDTVRTCSISIHANSFRLTIIRGTIVYTVSDRRVRRRWRKRDRGLARTSPTCSPASTSSSENSNEVLDILVDLIRRETRTFEMVFAQNLVEGTLRQHRKCSTIRTSKAGFKRAHGATTCRRPDRARLPLQPRQDEQLLLSDEWRQKMAGAVSGAIDACSPRPSSAQAGEMYVAAMPASRPLHRGHGGPVATGGAILVAVLPYFAHIGTTRVDGVKLSPLRRASAAPSAMRDGRRLGLERE